MNKDAEGRWKVGMSNIKLKMRVKMAWPDLHYATAKGVLILYPSKPAIAPTTGPQRLGE